MIRNFFLSLFMMIVAPAVVWGVSPTSKAIADLTPVERTLYDDVCSYDSLCSRSLHDAEKPTTDQLISARIAIWTAAKLYGIDPRAIAGSILAEHSMNTNTVDDIQDQLVRSGQAPTGSFLSKKFSFGFGQLYQAAAISVEKLSAKREDRPERSDREVALAILTPEGSIYYVAALIEQAQMAYKNNGYDIHNNLGVLTTLYNIGKIDERLARTVREKRLPKPNYFGVFTILHAKEIDAIVGKDPTSKPKPPAATPVITIASPLPSVAVVAVDPTVERISVVTSIRASNGPKGCFPQNIYPVEKIEFKPGAILSLEDAEIDCDWSGWRLVRDQTGQAGWVSEADLQKNGQKVTFPEKQCTTRINEKCLSEAKSLLGEHFSASAARKRNGLAEFSLFTNAEEIEKAAKNTSGDPNALSLLESSVLSAESDKDRALRRLNQGYHELKPAEIKEVHEAILGFQRRVAEKLNLGPWGDDAENPYAAYYASLFQSFLDTCVTNQTCDLNPTVWKEWLKSIPIRKAPTDADFKIPERFEGGLEVGVPGYGLNRQMEIAGQWRKDLSNLVIKPLRECHAKLTRFPLAKQAFEASILEIIQQVNVQGAKIRSQTDLDAYYRSNAITQMVSSLQTEVTGKLGEVCSVLTEMCKDTQGELKTLFTQCEAKVWDSTTQSIRTELATVFNSMYKNDHDRDLYFAGAFQEIKPTLTFNANSFQSEPKTLTVRDLANQLAGLSCHPPVYVSLPWMAQAPNQIYRKLGVKNSRVWVDFGSQSCTLEKGKTK